MSNPEGHELYKLIHQEHQVLRPLLDSIQHALSSREDTVSGIATKFDSLCNQIKTHFNVEETSGFFTDIVAQTPRFSQQADQLYQEHGCLLKKIQALTEQAARGDGPDDWWRQLESSFQEFNKQLREHESKENDLLLQSYQDDIGSAG